jgi:hypothetical protein
MGDSRRKTLTSVLPDGAVLCESNGCGGHNRPVVYRGKSRLTETDRIVDYVHERQYSVWRLRK